MDLASRYKGVVGFVFGNENTGSSEDSYVERLLDRISNGVLAEDRRNAIAELQSVVAESHAGQLAFGAMGFPVLLSILKEERDDVEMVRGALETLVSALTPINHAKGPTNEVQPALMNADLLSRESESISLLLTLLSEEDFYVRYYTLQILTALLTNSPNRLQEAILSIPRGITRLMDMLMDREVIRNEALLLLTYLTREAEEIQKIVVFEGGLLDLFLDISELVLACLLDCLELLNNLLRSNASNQVLLRETMGFDPLISILKLRGSSYSFTQQKTINLLSALETINLLMMGGSEADPQKDSNMITNKTVLAQKKLLDHLLMLGVESQWAPISVRCSALRCIGDLVAGHSKNVDALSSKVLGEEPQVEPALNSILRIILRTSSMQEFIAADHVFKNFCEKNSDGQAVLASTLIPQPNSMTHAPLEEDVNMSFGSMLLHGLALSESNGDLETCCRAASILTHILKDNTQCKERVLRIELEAPMPSLGAPELLLHRIVRYLAIASSMKNKDGKPVFSYVQPIILKLLITWLADCPSAVQCFLDSRPHLTYLLELVSNTSSTLCVRGLAAVLLGECVIYNKSSENGKDGFTIADAISQKIGLTSYFLKFDEMQRSFLFSSVKHGSESPSRLLNGETLNVEPIADLDLFFERLYSYYCEKGLWCIIIKWIVELLSLGFTICFSGFFLLFVDWYGLRNAKCGMDALESGIKPCDLAKEALHQHPLTPLTLSKAIIVGYLGLFSIYWIFCFLRFFAQLKDTLGIRHFYYNSLHVTDNEIQTMSWATILERVVQLQSSQQLCVVKDLSAHDVVMRLMRKENYLIGMLNKGVLAFPISPWVPGAGPTVKFGPHGTRHRLILTKTLEWTLNWCILQSMFDRNFCVRRDFLSNPRTLRKRLMVVGLAMLLLSPFLVIFMLVYLFLRHAEQFYNHPSTASSRRWSNLSKWMFREFNEVDHLFKHRINSSVMHASEYLKRFPSPIISIIAKFISFVSGGFAAILIIIAFLEESLLEGHIFGRNLFWYAAVFGTITAVSRAAITDELLVLDSEGAMSMVVQHIHYMPKGWRGKENTEKVRIEFETLFQYTGMMLLEEMASIFLTPFLLLFVVPKRVDDILQFIADFTVDVEGVGHVCSFSTFDFQKHGNSNYGSPHNAPRVQRSSQGKMEKSFLSFQSSYPSWEPDAQGKQFLSNVRTFREQKLQGQGARHVYSPGILWRGDELLSREMQQNIPDTGCNLGSLWLINADQNNHPYLLDWYYTSRPHHLTSYRRDATATRPSELAEQQHGDYWVPTITHNEARDECHWPHHYDNLSRSQSHLEASTSAPLFHESVLQHHDTNELPHDTRSHWWARSGPHGTQPQSSFLEPPDFNRYPSDRQYDNLSEGSVEEQDQFLVWRDSRRLSRTIYMDDLEGGGGDVNLHFDDIYSRPPETPTVNLRPLSFD